MATLVLVASPFPGKLGVARHSIRGNCSRVSWKSTRITEGSSTPPWLAGRCFRTWLPKIEGPTVGGGQRVATSSPQPRGMVCDTIFAVIHYFLYSMRDYIVIYKGSTRYIARVCRQFLFEIFFSFLFRRRQKKTPSWSWPHSGTFRLRFPSRAKLISSETLCSSRRHANLTLKERFTLWCYTSFWCRVWILGNFFFLLSSSSPSLFLLLFFVSGGNLKLFTFFFFPCLTPL